MSRLLAVIILVLFHILSPDFGIGQSLPNKAERNAQLKKLDLYSRLYPVYVRDTLTSWRVVKKYLHVCLEDSISLFLGKYYNSNYAGRCNLISKSPITFLLSPVQGYVTKHFWENVIITIDNIRWIKNTLLFQVAMRGEYLKVATMAVSRDSFDNAYFLEKDYVPELTIRCKEVRDAFKLFLRSKL